MDYITNPVAFPSALIRLAQRRQAFISFGQDDDGAWWTKLVYPQGGSTEQGATVGIGDSLDEAIYELAYKLGVAS